MDSQGQSGLPGPTGRRLHIAHRRSPSELTPLMSTAPLRFLLFALQFVHCANMESLTVEQLAIQQQIELLQQQQQQIAATHQQYVNLGMIPPQQHLQPVNAFPQMQGQVTMPGMSPHANAFQFPAQLQQQQLGVPINTPTQPSSHRRNQSALPNMSMGPPPAPSSGASGSSFGDFHQQSVGGQGRDGGAQRGGRGGPAGGGHQRRHSLALPEAKKAAELAQQKRTTSGFQFPIPGAANSNRSVSPAGSDDKGGQAQPQQISQANLSVRTANRGVSHGRSQSMAVGNGRSPSQGRGAGGFQFPPPMATNDAGASSQPGQSDFQRRGSQTGHGRSSSRNFEGNWRQQNNLQGQLQEQQAPMGNFTQPQNPTANVFQPGHRARASMNQSISSIGSFQYATQPQLVQLPPVLVSVMSLRFFFSSFSRF